MKQNKFVGTGSVFTMGEQFKAATASKKNIIIFICITLAVAMAATAVLVFYDRKGSISDPVNYTIEPQQSVVMHITESSNDHAKYQIINMDSDILLEESPSVQVLQDDVWYELTANGKINNLGILPFPGQTEEIFTANWEDVYGMLPPGKYRLVRSYSINNEFYTLAAEFDIT